MFRATTIILYWTILLILRFNPLPRGRFQARRAIFRHT